MKNQAVTQKSKEQEMKVYDPCDLFEIGKEHFRFREDKLLESDLSAVCNPIDLNNSLKDYLESISSSLRFMQYHENSTILSVDNKDLRISIDLIQNLSMPYKINLENLNKEEIRNLFEKFSIRYMIRNNSLYYHLPFYTITADFTIKNYQKLDAIRDWDDVKREGMVSYLFHHILTENKILNKLMVREIESEVPAEIPSLSKLIFHSLNDRIKNTEPNIMEVVYKKDYDFEDMAIFEWFKLIEENKDLRKTKVKEGIPLIKLDTILENPIYLIPTLVEPNLGFKYILGYQYSYLNNTTLSTIIGQITELVPPFFEFNHRIRNNLISVPENRRQIIKSREFNPSNQNTYFYIGFSIGSSETESQIYETIIEKELFAKKIKSDLLKLDRVAKDN